MLGAGGSKRSLKVLQQEIRLEKIGERQNGNASRRKNVLELYCVNYFSYYCYNLLFGFFVCSSVKIPPLPTICYAPGGGVFGLSVDIWTGVSVFVCVRVNVCMGRYY